MNSRVKIKSTLFSVITLAMLAQCHHLDSGFATPTIASQSPRTKTLPSTSRNKDSANPTESFTPATQEGCRFPPILVAGPDVESFYWSEDSKAITYRMQDHQTWLRYIIISGQIDSSSIDSTPTDSPDYPMKGFSEVFVSPSKSKIVFTRGTPEKYDVYYKQENDDQEYHLGSIRGYIKEVDWFDKDEQAVIAMEWQLPIYPDAHVYLIDFRNRTLTVEISRLDEYQNIEYLDLTPDEKQILFLSFSGKDRTAKLWDIATNEISFTPIFNPRDFQWINENELISVYLDSGLTSEMNLLIYDIKQSKIIFLAERKFRIEQFEGGSIQISPNGLNVAFIEFETRNLFWLKCDF